MMKGWVEVEDTQELMPDNRESWKGKKKCL
jgi:hypothetical protein